jgi:hypothetical protein
VATALNHLQIVIRLDLPQLKEEMQHKAQFVKFIARRDDKDPYKSKRKPKRTEG